MHKKWTHNSWHITVTELSTYTDFDADFDAYEIQDVKKKRHVMNKMIKKKKPEVGLWGFLHGCMDPLWGGLTD